MIGVRKCLHTRKECSNDKEPILMSKIALPKGPRLLPVADITRLLFRVESNLGLSFKFEKKSYDIQLWVAPVSNRAWAHWLFIIMGTLGLCTVFTRTRSITSAIVSLFLKSHSWSSSSWMISFNSISIRSVAYSLSHTSVGGSSFS